MKAKNIILCLLAALGLCSCGSEILMANRFIAQSKNACVAVYFPEEAQVTLIQDTDGSYSRVLDSIDQNQFLDIMYEAYADGLRDFGLEVYVPEDPDYVQVDSLHWLVILSKVELQGLFTEYVDYLYDFTDEYNYTFSLNTINAASWYDINDGEWLPTVYDEFNLCDEFDSHVTYSRENGTQYHYNITPLKAADVYNFAVFLGKRQASFTYDYMMNRYIASGMKSQNAIPRFKLRWDPKESTYSFQLDGEGFIELRGEN